MGLHVLLQYEVQILRSLCHPNILPFYCSFVTRQEVWNILPLMQYGMLLEPIYKCRDCSAINRTLIIMALSVAKINCSCTLINHLSVDQT